MFPCNGMGKLDDLTAREAIGHATMELLAHHRRCVRQRVGELDHEPLGRIEHFGVLPVGHGEDLVITEAQLTAERDAEILSPHATDERRCP